MYLYNFYDLWPYVLILLFVILSSFFKNRQASTLIFVVLLLFSALRFDVGWDYWDYFDLFKDYDDILNGRYELVNKIIMYAGYFISPYATFAIYSVLILYPIKYFIDKQSSDAVISWMFFISFPLFFLTTLSTLRQSLSISFFFLAIFFFKNKRYFKYFIFSMLSIFSHTSGIIIILAPFIIRFNFSRKILFLLILISLFLGSSIEYLITRLNFDNSYFAYLKYYVDNSDITTTSLQYLVLALALFGLLFYNKLVSINPDNKMYISLSAFGAILFNVFIFEGVTASRLASYYLMFYILIIADYKYLASRDKLTVVLSKFCYIIVLSTLLFYYIGIYINGYNSGVLSKISFLPYKVWFLYE